MAAAETATFATTQRVSAIVRPRDRSEVEACVRIANQYKTPIYPYSCGKNWGLGSRVPLQSGSALIDLGRMNQIVRYDERFAYLVVQPGVTFRQAHRFLRDECSPHFAAVTGGPPDGSLIGNALERGSGPGPYGDRAAHVCGLEVVLPTGETIRTGFGRFPHARTTAVHQWGVGPYLDGLFMQSNLGIVTEMTVWLPPTPQFFQRFACNIDSTADLARVIDAVQPLVLQGVLSPHSFGLWNAYKVLAERGRYPWGAVGHQTPLSLLERTGREPWFATGALYSTTAAGQAAERELIEEALSGLPNRPSFKPPEHHTDAPDAGIPTDRNVRTMYWRKKSPTALHADQIDPDRDRCGVVWVCPSLPFAGEDVVRAMEAAEATVKSHGFEPNIGMTCVTGRRIDSFVAVMYDREVPGEDARAMDCHDALLDALVELGYPPYRLGVQSMDALPASSSGYERMMQALKTALDPNDILSPGRYDMRSRWPGRADESVR